MIPSMLEIGVTKEEETPYWQSGSILNRPFMASGIFSENESVGSLSGIYKVYRGSMRNIPSGYLPPKDDVTFPADFQARFNEAMKGIM